jgi:hypothetical protein
MFAGLIKLLVLEWKQDSDLKNNDLHKIQKIRID